MKTSNLSDKQFKVLVIKIFIDFGRRLDEHTENLNKYRKDKKVPNRSLRIEEYKNETEKYTRGVQQQTR